MDKSLLAVTLFPVDFKGSISDPFESEREIEILTDSSDYKIANQIKINVNFKNDLSRDIKIINDGYAIPFFILEKKVENIWKEVYFPVCYSLVPSFVKPTDLKQGEKFTSEIVIYTARINGEDILGEYRLYFDLIDKETNKRLQGKFIYSNVFRITK